MQHRTLASGDTIPMLGLGTWQNTKHVAPALDAALASGYRHIDCAAIYLNEATIGQLLPSLLQKHKLAREDIWITSKLWNSFHAKEEVLSACHNTLKNLQLDYLDLYLMHWPVAQKASLALDGAFRGEDYISLDDLPLTQTWLAMQELVKAGLVKNIGVSNFSSKKIQHLMTETGITPSVNQVECHPYLSQQPLNDFCQQNNIALTAYSPLGASGRPKFMKDKKSDRLLDDPVLKTIADALKATPAQIALAWSMQHNHIVIPKSTNPKRIAENIKAVEITLSNEQMQQIDNLNRDQRFIDGKFFEMPGSPYSASNIWDE